MKLIFKIFREFYNSGVLIAALLPVAAVAQTINTTFGGGTITFANEVNEVDGDETWIPLRKTPMVTGIWTLLRISMVTAIRHGYRRHRWRW